MGQEEVINILKKVGKPMSRTEIAEALGYAPTQVSHIIKRLKKYGEVCEIELDRKQAYDYYETCKVHRRMRLYFLEED